MLTRPLVALALLGFAGCGPPAADEPAAPRITPDVIYGHKLGMALTLDVYAPEEPNGAGILYLNSGSWISPMCTFHGGGAEGFRIEPDACPSVNPGPMLGAGFTVFNVRHGSAPRFNVSEATDDVRLALRFVRDNADSLGVDPAMLELVPALDMPAEMQRRVSPIHYVTGDDPPTLIIHGDRDDVVPIASGKALHAALTAADVETDFITLEGASHGFTGGDAERALASSLEWFERHLGS